LEAGEKVGRGERRKSGESERNRKVVSAGKEEKDCEGSC